MESIKKEKENQRKTNKMFVKGSTLNGLNGGEIIKSSTMRLNREYLISQDTANKFNSYVSFNPFPVFNDGVAMSYDKDGNLLQDQGSGVGTPGVRSLFNKAGAVVLGSSDGNMDVNVVSDIASSWRISNNVPLMDNVESRRAIRTHSGCSIKELVIASENGDLGRSTYDFSDFMYCKHLGKISNNYLITLRRFPLPVDDYISTLGIDEGTRRSKDIRSKNVQSIGCLVTWMGTPGNEMSNLLKYSYSMPYKEQEAKWEEDSTNADANTSILNSVASMFDKTYQQQYQQGMVGASFNNVVGKFFNVGDPPYSISQVRQFQDSNKVYGPVDAIKSTYMRGSEGLKFDQNITLVFDYELRSYNGINGRQAMLDLLSNILNVTYSTGTFWGGGYKGIGAHQNNIFTNLNIFKTKGGFTDFADSFAKDYSNLTGSLKSSIASNGGLLQTVKNFMNQLGGMLVGGALNKLGRPHKVMLNSLLSPAPVGFWHVTIGNPHHPIMSMGNMILKNTTIEHYGPLGLDDFPTGIKVTCELTRGKPRDIRDIEKIYMHGNDRIYTSMGPKVFEMYKHAKEYKEGKKELDSRYKQAIEQSISEGAEPTIGPGLEGHVTTSDLKSMSSILQKYFGHQDTYSIYVAACEQENGAHKKKKAGTAGGDSRARGTGKSVI